MTKRFWTTTLTAAMLLGASSAALAQDKPATPPATPPVTPTPVPAPAKPETPQANPTPGEGQKGTAKLEVSEKEWNFGDVWQGEPLTKTITVKNTGDAPMTIEVRTSCGCTAPSKPKSPLGPGEQDNLTITYAADKKKGQVNQVVTIVTNDATNPNLQFPVKGNVKAVYEMVPADGMVFGQLFKDSEETKTVAIENKYNEKMFLKLKEGQDFGSFNVELKEVEPGQKYELKATTKPPLQEGMARIDVVLQTQISRIPEIKIPVYGIVQAPVSIRPNKIFWPKNNTSPIERKIHVSYSPKMPIKITSAKASMDSIQVKVGDKQNQPDSAKLLFWEITVTLPANADVPAGTTPTVEITTDASDPAYQKFSVPITVLDQGAASPIPIGPGGTKPGTGKNPTPTPTPVKPQPGTGKTPPPSNPPATPPNSGNANPNAGETPKKP